MVGKAFTPGLEALGNLLIETQEQNHQRFAGFEARLCATQDNELEREQGLAPVEHKPDREQNDPQDDQQDHEQDHAREKHKPGREQNDPQDGQQVHEKPKPDREQNDPRNDPQNDSQEDQQENAQVHVRLGAVAHAARQVRLIRAFQARLPPTAEFAASQVALIEHYRANLDEFEYLFGDDANMDWDSDADWDGFARGCT